MGEWSGQFGILGHTFGNFLNPLPLALTTKHNIAYACFDDDDAVVLTPHAIRKAGKSTTPGVHKRAKQG
jgi:hypothetical protein